MDIIKLPPGELASADTDCIKIDKTEAGDFTLVASALMMCGDGDDPESIALVGGDTYPTYEEAEAAGLAWAEAHCVSKIYIETGC